MFNGTCRCREQLRQSNVNFSKTKCFINSFAIIIEQLGGTHNQTAKHLSLELFFSLLFVRTCKDAKQSFHF